jgi:hypothetical protein
MTLYNVAVKTIRVAVFTGGLIVLVETLRFVLTHPLMRTALGTSLLLLGVFAILAAWEWTLRKLWILSGIVVAVVLASPDAGGRRLQSNETKTEVQS